MIAQIEMAGAILTRVRVRQGIFLLESTFSPDSLAVFTQPPCAIACIIICVNVKNLKHWQLHYCLDTRKFDILIGMGSTVLAGCCTSLIEVRPPEFPARDKEVLNKYIKSCKD